MLPQRIVSFKFLLNTRICKYNLREDLKNITLPEEETKHTNRKGSCFPWLWPTISDSQRSPGRKACSRLRDCRVREIEKVRTLCESLEQAKLSRLWLVPVRLHLDRKRDRRSARGDGKEETKGTWRQGTSWSNRPDEMAYFPSLKFHLSPPLIIRHLESGSGINCWLEKSLLAIFPSV